MAKIIKDEYSKENIQNTITTIHVKPGQVPEIIKIPNTLEAKQNIVGGYIQAVYPFEDEVALICNDEADTPTPEGVLKYIDFFYTLTMR